MLRLIDLLIAFKGGCTIKLYHDDTVLYHGLVIGCPLQSWRNALVKDLKFDNKQYIINVMWL